MDIEKPYDGANTPEISIRGGTNEKAYSWFSPTWRGYSLTPTENAPWGKW